MKLYYRISLSLIFVVLFQFINAQTDPGTANLTHQWTFDDGNANDKVGNLNGFLNGGATIENKALKLSAAGQYLMFSGPSLAINSYTAISQEIWFSSKAAANTGYTMLSYFGNTSGGQGYNYLSLSAARGDNVTRAAISNGTYNGEKYVNTTEYDDGKLHHMVSIVRQDSIILYVDGALVGKTASGIALSTLSNSYAYLGKGGYTSDPTWLGTISKFSLYNKSLSATEVKYLYQQGAESTPILSASVSNLAFDDILTSQTINITAINISGNIAVTAPAGITLSSQTLASTAVNSTLTISYDGTTVVNDTIRLTSSNAVCKIPVKSYSNSCFTKLYPTFTNLVTDPYVSSLSNFAGWGTRSLNTDQAYVFCGASSGKVNGTNAGSLDVSLTGKLQASTDYRIRAKVLPFGGNFQIGLSGTGTSTPVKTIAASTTWQTVDFTITTGTIGSAPSMYFNNYGLSGVSGYIDNWEMYAVPKIYTMPASLTFDTQGTKLVAVRAVNITETINLSTTEGFVASVATLPANTGSTTINVSFNGNSSTTGYLYFTSGAVKDSLKLTGSVAPKIVPSTTKLLVDELSNSTSFTVKAYNLSSDINITAPAGITVNPSTLPANSNGNTVSVSYNGLSNSTGQITLTANGVSENINISANRNDACFTPLYADKVNLIADPTCNTSITEGWGSKSINSDPAYVYCGARSIKVNGSGSVERNLTGVLQANKTYRVKAKVYKYGSRPGQNMGNVTYTLGIDSVALPEAYRLIKTAMDSACMYFSKYTPFTFDIPIYYSAGIPTAQASYHGSIGFGANTRYMWVGTAIHEMCHWFGSGTTSEWQSKIVGGVWTGAATQALMGTGTIKGDSQHFWPNGINQKEEITNLGSIAAQEAGLVAAVKVAKAMIVDDAGLPTNNIAVGVGVTGWDSTKDDLFYEVSTTNGWHDIDFTFTTGSALKSTQKVYFNSGTGYIDNWEMYEVTATGLKNTALSAANVSVVGRRVVIDFELFNPGIMEVMIYNLNGSMIQHIRNQGLTGENQIITDALTPGGVYLLKLKNSDDIKMFKLIF